MYYRYMLQVYYRYTSKIGSTILWLRAWGTQSDYRDDILQVYYRHTSNVGSTLLWLRGGKSVKQHHRDDGCNTGCNTGIYQRACLI